MKQKCLVKEILTAREKEYLALVALGYKNHRIAKILFVSHSTVKKTLETVFRKLKAQDRTNAVVLCLMHEILNMQEMLAVKQKYCDRLLEQEKVYKYF